MEPTEPSASTVVLSLTLEKMSAAEAVRVPVPGVRLRIDDEQLAVFPFRPFISTWLGVFGYFTTV